MAKRPPAAPRKCNLTIDQRIRRLFGIPNIDYLSNIRFQAQIAFAERARIGYQKDKQF